MVILQTIPIKWSRERCVGCRRIHFARCSLPLVLWVAHFPACTKYLSLNVTRSSRKDYSAKMHSSSIESNELAQKNVTIQVIEQPQKEEISPDAHSERLSQCVHSRTLNHSKGEKRPLAKYRILVKGIRDCYSTNHISRWMYPAERPLTKYTTSTQ